MPTMSDSLQKPNPTQKPRSASKDHDVRLMASLCHQVLLWVTSKNSGQNSINHVYFLF